MRHVAGERHGEVRQRLTFCLGNVKDRYGLEIVGNSSDRLFLGHDISVLIQHGSLRVGIEDGLLDFFHGRCGREDLDALLALFDVTPEFVLPGVEACHLRRIRALHMNQDLIIDGIAVKPAHGRKVAREAVTLKELPYSGLDAVCDLLDPFLIGLFCWFWHDYLTFTRSVFP